MELFELSETLVIVLKRTLCWLEKYLQDISNNASPYKCEEILTAQASSLSIWCFAQSVAASAFTFWRIFTQNSSSDLSNGGSVSFFRDSCSMSSSRCGCSRRRNKSPSDLEADDENDHDSLNQAEGATPCYSRYTSGESSR